MPRTIAIDGPVGAGKSTIAKALANALGILYLDTGAMYRAFALKSLRHGIPPHDAAALAALAERTLVGVKQVDGAQYTYLDGEDVTGLLRTPEVSAAASAISMNPVVRQKMVALQRQCADREDMVLDGRDIGTRVLPNATFKFFLNALPEERAKRRYLELTAQGVACTYHRVLEEMMARDKQDSERAVDPLRRAEDAVEIDTTDMNLRQVVELLLSIIQEDGNEG